MPSFEPLSPLDSAFLALDGPTTPMHAGAVLVFEGAGPVHPGGAVDFERISAHVLSRLHLLGRWRQRLAFVPQTGSAVWVDDDAFDLDHHLRHVALPSPGDDDALAELVGRVLTLRIERSRPLWELWVVEGLSGNRFALIVKVHHAMTDGMAGLGMLDALLQADPSPTNIAGPIWQPRPAPSGAHIAVEELALTARRSIDRLSGLAEQLRERLRHPDDVGGRVRSVGSTLATGWAGHGPTTPINREIGPYRTVAWTTTSLDEAKLAAHRLGGTVNDVELATVAGAVAEFLRNSRDFTPTAFRAMVPVNLRTSTRPGNELGMWLVDLPVGSSRPAERLTAVAEQTSARKRLHSGEAAATLVDATRAVPLPALTVLERLAGRHYRPFNMTVTNLPGPGEPRYLLDARLAEIITFVPLWTHQGLGVAVLTYEDFMAWGVTADRDVVPDVAAFVNALDTSFAQLTTARP